MWNRYLDFVIDPRLQGVYILFVLSFKNDDVREIHKQYYLPTVETKDYNVMIKEDISLISQNKTKKDLKFIISSERLQQAKVMVIKQDVY